MPDLSQKEVLDVECGGRFTQAIINRDIPIKSYTGIDIYEELIDYLRGNIRDARFTFYHRDIYNELYRKKGEKLTRDTELPLTEKKKFDIIWLFSVLTHLTPEESENLLYCLRKHIKDDGYLFFSAFLDKNIVSFEDRIKDKALLKAYYNERFMEKILSKTKWKINSVHDPNKFIVNYFVCTPR